jgi:hypothetical protein
MIVYRCSFVLCVVTSMIYNIHRINIHGLESMLLSLYVPCMFQVWFGRGRHFDYILPAPRTTPDYSFDLIYILQQNHYRDDHN